MKFTQDIVIGLEIHLELNTKTKLFCSCGRDGDDSPNSRTCPICLGHPGTKPALNKKAIKKAIKICLALDAEIDKELIFSRKSYFYPDMSKNFQITQFEQPLATKGKLKLRNGKTIELTRLHLEEDPASLSYPKSINDSLFSFIDYNRAGNPLLEIVTEPVISSPEEAREFLNELLSLISYLEVFDNDKGIIKVDANISIKESDYTRIEIKNITGFKELEKALHYEITRQRAYLRRGVKIVQETRGWSEVTRSTKTQRTKETEADYGYIIDPDISITSINDELKKEMSKEIPELPAHKIKRYVQELEVDESDAEVIAHDKPIAEFFEIIANDIEPKLAARWIRREVLRVLNYNDLTIETSKIKTSQIVDIVTLIKENKISETTGQKLMEKIIEEEIDVIKYIQDNDLMQVSSSDELNSILDVVIKENAQAVDEYKAGAEKSFHYLIGQVMRKTKGKANPQVVNKLMKEKLS